MNFICKFADNWENYVLFYASISITLIFIDLIKTYSYEKIFTC